MGLILRCRTTFKTRSKHLRHIITNTTSSQHQRTSCDPWFISVDLKVGTSQLLCVCRSATTESSDIGTMIHRKFIISFVAALANYGESRNEDYQNCSSDWQRTLGAQDHYAENGALDNKSPRKSL
ncbi:hypothetical protein TSAR_006913 [Trichomalopsis sarcophagae]|uniref:Uncharacterized protein n=1 Tax=Trichomalopsis sarcophagae TaxID=543379 RepID=A0A232EFI1_9HYME|nr:hypothetical protein TSAR_006913 [Trichomalopsis sarcophagae]